MDTVWEKVSARGGIAYFHGMEVSWGFGFGDEGKIG